MRLPYLFKRKPKTPRLRYVEAFKAAQGKTGWQKQGNCWYNFGPPCPGCGAEMERGANFNPDGTFSVSDWGCVHCGFTRG